MDQPKTTHPDADLALMLDAMGEATGIYRPSPFWARLAREHVGQLAAEGFENFKRTVNMRYFNWGLFGIFAHQLLPLAWWWLKYSRRNFLGTRISGPPPGNFSRAGGILYAWYVGLLYLRVAAGDKRNLFATCRESKLGNPVEVQIAPGLIVTQDLCNSIHEFSRVCDAAPPPSRVIEIGAGYGRLAAVFLHAEPGVKYWIVDIPPALYISQRYLGEAFPGKKIFKFRPFATFDSVAAEVEAADICFFLADQIEKLPPKSVQTAICISNLHEMTRAQIAHYFQQIDRLTTGTAYTKQWMRSIATENGFSIPREDYPVPAHWRQTFNRRHPIQSWFFEAGYEIP